MLYAQISSHFENILSKYLCGFRKGYSTQHSLFNLLRNWQSCLDKSGTIGAILMDLSKAYDCIPHDLLLAKMAAYGVSLASLRLIHSYLTNRKQRVRIGHTLSEWLEIIMGVPQGSILGPILFNIFLNDLVLFIMETEICNFADDTTIYSCDFNPHESIQKLENDMKHVLTWFKINSMVANPAKFQFIILGKWNSQKKLCLDIDGRRVVSSAEVKLLGVKIDDKLSFLPHIKDLRKKSIRKINALQRIRNYMTLSQAKLINNAYIISSFSYCPLIWMFSGKSGDTLINRAHYRALKVTYGLFEKSFDELIIMDESVTTHIKNIQTLMLEVYKSINRINPEFMWDLFQLKDMPYNMRAESLLSLPPTKTRTFGINSLIFRGSILWNSLPNNIKLSLNTNEFKANIKNCKIFDCNCRICS